MVIIYLTYHIHYQIHILNEVLLVCCHLRRASILAALSLVIRVGPIGDLLHNLTLLLVVVATFIFDTLLLGGILLVLSFQVMLELAELSLDLVFSILADHFDGA